MGEHSRPHSLTSALTPPQLHAARYVVARVRSEIDADLEQAALFGSRARGDARPDSDVDLLLVFRALPPDREPHATQAEAIAEEEAVRRRIPVTAWSVSLVDLVQGNRTPMLVDALVDAIPVWCAGPPLPPVSFTPQDSIRCVEALLRRTAEGSAAFRWHYDRGDLYRAATRLRDDLLRVCTASLLLQGVTRPRFGEALRACRAQKPCRAGDLALFDWAERSFGPDGKDDERPVAPPPGGLVPATRLIERLRRDILRGLDGLRARVHGEARLGTCERGAEEWTLRSRMP